MCSVKNERLPLLSQHGLHVLNLLLPGNPDRALVNDDDMKKISKEIVSKDNAKASNYISALAEPLRNYLLKKANLEGASLPLSKGDHEKLRGAVRATMLQFVMSYLVAIYPDGDYAANPDHNLEDGNDPEDARFEAGVWSVLTVLCLDKGHVALNCEPLSKW